MSNRSYGRVLEKPEVLKRIGYSLIVVALVFLLLISTSAALHSALVAAYSYILIGLGVVLVLTNKILEYVQLSRIRRRRVYCANCGWSGNGAEWFESESCPECDAEEVVLL